MLRKYSLDDALLKIISLNGANGKQNMGTE